MIETTECYEGRGVGYRGTVDVTPTGLTCQRWDSQYPHNHTFTPQAYSCKWVGVSRASALLQLIAGWLLLFSRDLRENYCRNPDGQELPWCFTTDPRIRMMFCTNIPECGTQNKADGEIVDGRIWESQRGERCVSLCDGDPAAAQIVIASPASVGICNPAGLWEGTTTAFHRNEFWQQRGMVRSQRGEEKGVSRSIFKAKDVCPWLTARMQSTFEIWRLHVFMSAWRCLLRLQKLPEAVWVSQE